VTDTNNDILLDVKNLRKFFPIQKGFLRRVVGHVRAVDDVTIYVRKGETLFCGSAAVAPLAARHPVDG